MRNKPERNGFCNVWALIDKWNVAELKIFSCNI
jgi:hypothetical protein